MWIDGMVDIAHETQPEANMHSRLKSTQLRLVMHCDCLHYATAKLHTSNRQAVSDSSNDTCVLQVLTNML